MNLIITGDNPKTLAEVESFARELGLTVIRELGHLPAAASSRLRRRETREQSAKPISEEHFPHRNNNPSYGIE